MAHYSQNGETIEACLIANKTVKEPLYPLFLQYLKKEERREISLRLWQAILEQLVTCHDPSLIYKDSDFQYVFSSYFFSLLLGKKVFLPLQLQRVFKVLRHFRREEAHSLEKTVDNQGVST